MTPSRTGDSWGTSRRPRTLVDAISTRVIRAALLVIVAAGFYLSSGETANAQALTCEAGFTYGTTSGQTTPSLRRVNLATGQTTQITTYPNNSNVNALGMRSDGVAYTTDNQARNNGQTVTIRRYDGATNTHSNYTGPAIVGGGAAGIPRGAINPLNGWYYFSHADSANGTLQHVYAFNTTTNTSVGYVGTFTTPQSRPNGDMAFDHEGNLLLVAANQSAPLQAQLYRISDVPTTPQSYPTALSGSQMLSLSGQGPVGVIFDANGYLYTQDIGTLYRHDPNTGAVLSQVNFTGGINLGDLGDCDTPGTLQLRKIIDGRVQTSDQFTLTITGGGLTGGNSATTTGNTTGLQNAIAGPVVGIPGTTYTLTETVSPSVLGAYANSITCVNTVNGSTIIPTRTGDGTWTLAFPSAASGVLPRITCTVTNTPLTRSISLDKQAGTPTGNTAGSTISYTFLLQNTGQVPLTSVSVTDPKVGTVTCPPGTLAPGATRTCTATYTVTQADVDAGAVNNTATASGTPPAGPAVTSPPDTTSTPITRTPSISMNKGAGPINDVDGNGHDVGDTITYSFAVTNTGNVTLNPVTVSDPMVSPPVTCPGGALPPGQTRNCTSRTYTLTQADVDAGVVTNTATASGTPPSGPVVTATGSTSTPVTRSPNLVFDKTAGPIDDVDGNGPDAGDTITYTFAMTNTGNVTLNPVTVSDPLLNPVVCPGGALAPGQSRNCTSRTYTLTQADVDAGVVDNTATASGTPPSGPVLIRPDSTSTPIASNPSISLDKQAGSINDVDGNGPDAGDTITYTFTVANTGNVTLNAVGVSDPKIGTVTCPGGALAPGATRTCTATYTLTQADVDAGIVDNTATATGTPPTGGPVTATDTESTSVPRTPFVSLDKQAGSLVDVDGNGPDAGDTIAYSFAVTNTGNVTLNPVTVSDPMLGTVTCPAGPLAPGATVTCSTVVYTVTQADVDAGVVNNTATVSGTPPSGPAVTGDDDTSTPIARTPSVALDKSAGSLIDVDGNGPDAGDTITYSFVVTNTGNVTLNPVTVSDPMLGTVTCPAGPLAPGATVTCSTVVYTVTQADVDAGVVNNTATVSGTPPSGPAVTGDDDTSTPIARTPSVALDKSAGSLIDVDGNGPDAGDTITYSFVVTNTGNVTLNPVTVSDPMLGTVTCPAGPLAPGATVTCSTVVYTVTQADVDAGRVDNVATATGVPPSGPAVTGTDDTTTPLPPAPALTLDKTAAGVFDANESGLQDAGDTITYTFVVTNTGNVTLNPVTVADPKVGTVTCPAGPLAPGATVDCTPVVYTLTQADVDAGAVENTATASGTPPTGDPVTATDTTSTAIPAEVALSLNKQAGAIVDANGSSRVDAGDTITYTFAVTNTGTVSLDPVTVSDPKVGPVTCPLGPLAPTETVACDAVVYTLTQADLDAGVVNNTATATGVPPVGEPATGTSSTSTPVSQVASLSLDKTAGEIVDANDSGRVDAGDTIAYTFAVENTGTVTLDPVTVSDPLVGVVTCPAGPLAPGATVNCDAVVYTLIQGDVDAGAVNNTATASGTPPDGPAVTGTDSTSTTIDAVASLSLDKTAGEIVDANDSGRVDAGDTIAYTFAVENTGTVTLDPVTVSDPLVGVVTCPAGPLAPGATVNCDAVVYTLTQADVDAGAVDNTATATGTPPTGDDVTDTDSTSTTVVQAASLDLTKSAGAIVDANSSGRVDAGDTITYTFAVENTGTVTLDPVTVDDPKAGAVVCPAGPLAPGATVDCDPVVYTLTQADLDAGTVDNTATASGTPPTGPTVTNTDSTTTPVEQSPSLELDKTAGAIVDANGNGRVDAGDTIAYSFAVQNTGTVTLDPVTVDDPKAGAVVCPAGPLAPGATVDCDPVVYTLTQADLDAGTVDNTATASGTPPTGPTVTNTDSTTTPVEQSPSLELDKTAGAIVDANGSGGVDAGDTIAYTFAVENTGTVTLDPVTVSDPLVGAVVCPAGPLVPGATVDCDAVAYTLTQADVDAGVVDNTATASGTPPTGDDVTDTDSTSSPVVQAASLVLTKTAGAIVDANGSGGVDAGDTIAYTFAVENTGTVTLDPVTVSDPLVGAVVCPAGPLVPGATVDCDAVAYTLTQADVDAGVVDNTATATGTPPAGPPVESTSSTSTPVSRIPGISLDKQAGEIVDANDSGRVDAGDTIAYTFVVENTGNVTLDPVTVQDPMLGGPIACPAVVLAPEASISCGPVTYTLTQADVNAGEVANLAGATGSSPSGVQVVDTDATQTPVARIPSLTFDKQATVIDPDGDGTGRDDTIRYTFVVENTGNVTLDPVTVQDPMLGGAIACPASLLQPGESMDCGPVDYVITQDDVDRGAVDNVAGVIAVTPTGSELVETDTTSTPIDASADLTLAKTAGAIVDANGSGRVDPGDTIAYTFAVENTGTVTLDPVTVSDPLVGAVVCPAGPLVPGATVDCDAVVYTLTQADVDAGVVNNTATATGTPPDGPDATDTDSTSTSVAQVASLILDKSAGAIVDANDNGRVDAGDTIAYTFAVENTGTVTLDPVSVSDPKVGSVVCPAGPLAPGATVDCDAVVYTLTQADLDAGTVDNTATASGTPPDGPAVTATDSTSTPVVQVASLELTKSAGAIVDANDNGRVDAGDTITYTFSVENTGTVTLDPVTVSDPMVGAVVCPAGPLAPSATVECDAAVYTLTQADVDAGVVDNTATATGAPPDGDDVTATDSTSTPVVQAASLELTKSAGAIVDANDNGRVDAGDTIAYTFAVENTGTVTLDPVTVSDPMVGAVTCPAGPLAPGATVNCGPVLHTLAQADLDAGVVNNTATATGTPPTGDDVTATDSTTTPVAQVAGLELTKTAGDVVDANDSGRVDAGDTIAYTFVVENTGTVTLDPVTVSDPMVGAVTCPAGPLVPGATVECDAAPYTLVQGDLDAGVVSNTATATGTPPTGDDVTGTDSITTPVVQTPGLDLTKTAGDVVDANDNGRVDAGDTIAYSFAVENTGTVTLDPVTVSDPMVGAVTCPAGPLAPGATVNCDPVVYTLTQADVDAGAVNNTATATGTPPTGDDVTATDSTTTPVAQTPSIGLDKTAGAIVDANGNGRVDAGDTIAYSFAVENTGAVTLDPVTVSDPMVGAVTCPAGPLAPGATVECDPVVYTLTQADVDAGAVNNTATASGTPPDGPAVTATDSTSTPIASSASLSLTKTAGAIVDANDSGRVDAGDTIAYSFAVENTGTVSLDPVSVSDPMVGAVTCPAGPLAPGTTVNCGPALYTLTQADLDAGVVNNTATATGTPPAGDDVTATDSTTTPVAQTPSLELTKTAGDVVDANDSGRVDAGDTIAYTFVVENTGTVTLDPVTVSDPMVGAVTCPAGPLAPGATVNCDAVTYTLTQADLDAGVVNNTATATGTPPTGDDVTGTDSTTTPVAQTPSIGLEKTAGEIVDANDNGRVDAGDTITYTFSVENTGTVTLNPITVSDPMLGAVTCPAGLLAPGATVDCDAVVYTLTQADVDAGVVNNTATATGTPPTGPAVTGTDSTTTPVAPTPGIGLDKAAGEIVDANDSGRVDAGDTITYSFAVENTGTVTLDPVTVSDPMLGAVTCPAGPLAPGATVDCDAALYTLTQADLDAGVVNNTASATGTPPTGPAVTDTDSTTTPVTRAPSITLDKQAGPLVDANGSGRPDPGDTIAYTFVVLNTGNVTLDPVMVTDQLLGGIVTCPVNTLAPGETVTCGPVTYTVTQADVTAGVVENIAGVLGVSPSGSEVVDTDSTSTPIDQIASLTLDKGAGAVVDANDNGRIDAGDTITFTLAVQNIGTVPLDPITVSDPMVGAVVCPAGPLAPGATVNCDPVIYTLTQADIDAGAVNNTATASGTPPNGPAITGTDSTSTPIGGAPALRLDKTAGAIVDANDNGRVDAGDTVAYTFSVQNTGTVTLDPVTVSDPKVGAVVCPAGPLAPGTTVDCDAVAYTLTQADVDAGAVNNTATATGTPPIGDDVTAPDSTTTPVEQVASLELDKDAGTIADANDNGRVDVGDTITYSFAVQNTGTVTLNPVTVSDPKVGAVTCPAGPLAPGATVTCDAVVYALTQADLDAGTVDNTATASGTPPTGPAVTDADSTTTPVPTTAALTLQKDAGPVTDVDGNGPDAGDTVAYTFAVQNTGTVTLDPVTVSDPKIGAVVCPAGPLAPGATVECGPAVYTLNQADVDAGVVDNTATASGTPPTGPAVTGTDTASTPVPASPAITLDKQDELIDPDGDGPSADDVIRYTFVVENTGNVTLDPVTVSDPKVGAVVCPVGPLAPDDAITCGPVDYTITQGDMDDTVVENTATASGTPPTGPAVTDMDSTTTSMVPNPRIALEKTAGPIVDANGNGQVDAGDTIDYGFLVRNTGNVTLGGIGIDDPMLGTVACPAGPLAPAASRVCGPVTYTLTSDDVTATEITNTATATGTPVGGDPITATDSVTTPVHSPVLDFEKQAGPVVDANGDGRHSAGDTITYTFTVTNNGNVPFDPVTVSDPKVGAVTCPAGPLLPGQTRTCDPVVYTVTADDIAAAQVVNQATVTGTPPSGSPVTATDTTTTPLPVPALGMEKRSGAIVDVDGNGNSPGDTVTFTFVVTNTGNVPISDLTIGDPMVTGITCPATVLVPGGVMACTAAPYTLTEANVAAGQIVNRAVVSGTSPGGDPVSAEATVTVPVPPPAPVPPAPAIHLTKTSGGVVDRNGNGVDAGDTIDFRFLVTNTGNVPLQDIVVTDPLVRRVDCPATALAPGASMTCTAPPYRITVADLNRGRVVNTATVRATPPGHSTVVMSGSVTVPTVGRPRLRITKTANRSVVRAGGLVTYTIRVRNTGNGPARNVAVCDLLAANVSVARRGGGRLRSGRLCFAPIRTLAIGRSRTYRVVIRIDRSTKSRATVNRAVAQAANARTVVARRVVRIQPPKRVTVRVPVTG